MNSKCFSVGNSLSLALTMAAQRLEDLQIEALVAEVQERWRDRNDGQEMPAELLEFVREVAPEAVRDTPPWQSYQRIRQEPTPAARAAARLREFGDVDAYVFGLTFEQIEASYAYAEAEMARMGIGATCN